MLQTGKDEIVALKGKQTNDKRSKNEKQGPSIGKNKQSIQNDISDNKDTVNSFLKNGMRELWSKLKKCDLLDW